MEKIGVDQSLSNSDLYEHWCLENVKNSYKSSIKCDNKYQYKYIIESDIVYNHEGLTDNSPIPSSPYVHEKS